MAKRSNRRIFDASIPAQAGRYGERKAARSSAYGAASIFTLVASIIGVLGIVSIVAALIAGGI